MKEVQAMNDREPNRRTNDALQSGEGNLALGEDERDFGAGRQRTQVPLSRNDAPNRKSGRDPTVPRGQGARISERRTKS
jgi:hypothetical protein